MRTLSKIACCLVAVLSAALIFGMASVSGSPYVSGAPTVTQLPDNVYSVDDIFCREDRALGWRAGELTASGFASYDSQLRSLRAKLRREREQGRPVAASRTRNDIIMLRGRNEAESERCMEALTASTSGKSTKFTLTAKAFAHKGTIPQENSCWVAGPEDPGEGFSPELAVANIPRSATHLALLVHDPDADFIHWFILISKKSPYWKTGLPLDVPDEDLEDIQGIYQEANDFGVKGYSGPCPPPGERHQYNLELYAVRGAKEKEYGDTAAQIRRRLREIQLNKTVLTGYFTGISSDEPTATPTPAATTTATHTRTDTPTPTATRTTTPSRTPTITPTLTPSRTPTATPSLTATKTPTNTPTSTPASTQTPTVTPTLTPTATATPTLHPASGFSYVSASRDGTCAIVRDTGGVQCWGGGQIYPTSLDGLSSGVVQVNRPYAVLDTGVVKNFDGTPVPLSLTNGAREITNGFLHTCVIPRALNERITCWGRNTEGQLGDGTRTSRINPAPVGSNPYVLDGAISITAGVSHTCGVLASGYLFCWGWNSQGQLGVSRRNDGNEINTYPLAVSVGGYPQVSAGNYHTCARTASGGVRCWGTNRDGEIGNGTESEWGYDWPQDVSGLSSGVSLIAAGGSHTCALLTSGDVKCWGYNGSGQVGDRLYNDRLVPSPINGLPSKAIQITAGSYHTCALLDTSEIMCWGGNPTGELGDGTKTSSKKPVYVKTTPTITPTATATDTPAPGSTPVPLSKVASITAGAEYTCARLHSGDLKCWGANSYGQLGDGTTTERHAPTTTISLGTGVTQVEAGSTHTCARTSWGQVFCWGNFRYTGRDGLANVPNRLDLSSVTQIAVGRGHSCALSYSGGVMCWGDNGWGQLGDGTQLYSRLPTQVPTLTRDVKQIKTGYGDTCAILWDGSVKCWGCNDFGQLGHGTFEYRYKTTPTSLPSLTSSVTQLAMGSFHTCALTNIQEAMCWGGNWRGQVGDGTLVDRPSPTWLTPLTTEIAQIATGARHSCAVLNSGAVKCWGDNQYGQLGDGTTTSRNTPTEVPSLGGTVTQITAGDFHTCAVLGTGEVKCWGYNSNGQLGDGTTVSALTPTTVVTGN